MRRTPAALRRELVAALEKTGNVRSPGVRRAFLRVPRELFIPEIAAAEGLPAIYKNEVFVTRKDSKGTPTSSSSMPGIMAPMLERLDVQPGHRVLEIGTGTGYNAALLAELVGATGRVVSVDIEPDLVRKARKAFRLGDYRVQAYVTDGRTLRGISGRFDRIIVTASSEYLPRAWHRHLEPGGLVVVPFRLRHDQFSPQMAVTFKKIGQSLESVEMIGAGFMALRPSATSDSPVTTPEGVVAYEYREGKPIPVCLVQGAILAKLNAKRRTALLATLLRGPRRTQVLRGPIDLLAIHLLLHYGTRGASAVDFRRGKVNGVGLLDPATGSLAAVIGKSTWTKDWRGLYLNNPRLESYGGRTAERLVLDAIEEWERLGRPKTTNLVLRTSYGARPSPGKNWRTQMRQNTVLELEWRQT